MDIKLYLSDTTEMSNTDTPTNMRVANAPAKGDPCGSERKISFAVTKSPKLSKPIIPWINTLSTRTLLFSTVIVSSSLDSLSLSLAYINPFVKH